MRCPTIPTRWSGAQGDGRAGRHHPRGRVPRRQAAAEIADPLDPVHQRHVRGREPRRRHDVRRHLDRSPASGRCAAARLHVPRRLVQRAECVPAGEGTRAESAIHVQSERDAVARSGPRSRCRPAAPPLYDSANIFAATSSGRAHAAGAAAERPDQLHRPGRPRAVEARTRCARCSSRTTTISGTSASAASICPIAPSGAHRATACCGSSRADRWRRAWFGESRLQVRCADTESAAVLEQPTIRVLDAFTAGGAQQDGGRTRRRDRVGHQRRLGARAGTRCGSASLVEGGSLSAATTAPTISAPSRLRASPTTRPASPRPTRGAIGDPLVDYSHWQAGLFVQDDWRARTEPDAERRTAPGDADPPRRPLESGAARRADVVAVQERQDDRPGRRRHLLRLARSGRLRADAARRRRPPAGSRRPQPRVSQSIRRRPSPTCCRPASTCSPTRLAMPTPRRW